VLSWEWFLASLHRTRSRPRVRAIGEDCGETLLERALNSSFCRRANNWLRRAWLTCSGRAGQQGCPAELGLVLQQQIHRLGLAGDHRSTVEIRTEPIRRIQLTAQPGQQGPAGPQTTSMQTPPPRAGRPMGLQQRNRPTEAGRREWDANGTSADLYRASFQCPPASEPMQPGSILKSERARGHSRRGEVAQAVQQGDVPGQWETW